MISRTSALLCTLVFAVAAGPAVAVDDHPLFDVPLVDNITIDGRLDDWGDQGFHIIMLTTADGRALPKTDLDAIARIGWNKQGLLIAVTVADDIAVEHPDDDEIWRRDSVELFLADQPGAKQYYQTSIAPGTDARHPQLRRILIGRGDLEGTTKLTLQAARTKTKSGYVLEILMPFEPLPITPQIGREVGFQFYVNDADDERPDFPFALAWYPSDDTSKDSKLMHRLRLSQSASPTTPLVRARGEHDIDALETNVYVIASDDQSGKNVAIVAADSTVASGTLALDRTGRVRASFRLPMPRTGEPRGPLAVQVDGKTVETLNLPSTDRKRAEAFLFASPNATPAVFSGDLPPIRFERPLWIRALIGPYKLTTTYYDKDYNVVASAKDVGRYGAVIEIATAGGDRVYRRFKTLYRMPGHLGQWDSPAKVEVTLSDELGIRPQAAAAYPAAIQKLCDEAISKSFNQSNYSAVLLAGLLETTQIGRTDDYYTTPHQRDRQWWLGFKRKFYGWDKQFPKPFVCPKPIEDKPAPVVRAGTLKEAGMKPNAAQQIDTVLTEWSNDTDEAFAVCIVRHGVIVLHQAYGQRDGQPMTVNTKSWMASTTKMLSGTLMMMLVDHALIDLDDRADKYLPPLRGLKTNRPLTIRHLYTHTSGLQWHWGMDINDMAERITVLLPHCQIGHKYAYNGTGMELATKILEGISGESLPNFYRSHLLVPLGCDNTDVSGAAGDATSVPLDIAKIGQMLLNKGAYGNMRFMKPETFKQMLPQRLTKVLGPDTDQVYGVGTIFFTDEGLGKGTFAHGAASSATTRIDPENDLVIVMTRNAIGKNFKKYHQPFINAVVEGIAD